MFSQRAIDIITRDFTTVAAGSSSIFKEHFSQLLERHLERQPTSAEVALLTQPFGEKGLQLDNWLQWLQNFPQSTPPVGQDCGYRDCGARAEGQPNQGRARSGPNNTSTAQPPPLPAPAEDTEEKAKAIRLYA